MSHQVFIWIALGFCLGLSFLLSGMEAGVFVLSRLRIRQQMRAGRRSARALHRYLENPENFLWTIFVGNTLANLFILGSLVVALHDALGAQRLPLFVAVYAAAVFLFYSFFDLLPKMLFRLYPNRLCMAMARPFGIIHTALRPLVALVESASRLLLQWRGGTVFTGHLFGNREELRQVMQESGQALSSEERAMINRVMDLQSQTVRQAMLPLAQVVTVPAGATVEDALKLCREQHLTRFPVWQAVGGVDRIVGLFNVNEILYAPAGVPGGTVAEHLKPALYLDEHTRLEVALRRMQRAGQRLAIVVSREQRELGILSLQDVLRIIFGEVSL